MAKIIDDEIDDEILLAGLEDTVRDLKDRVREIAKIAIEKTKPSEDATLEEKLAYEFMKFQSRWNDIQDFYIKADELNMFTAELRQELYDMVKPASDASDSIVKKLRNQIDGEY